jgi:DNA-directed RNA polymerase subunit M/transcription elongation factor TFIIS
MEEIKSNVEEVLRCSFKKLSLINDKPYDHKIREIIDSYEGKDQTVFCRVMGKVNELIFNQPGLHPNEIIGVQYLDNKITAKELLKMKPTHYPKSQRELMQQQFIKTLIFASPVYKNNQKLVIETALEIEKSCFNATIIISINSEDPPRRRWDSPLFSDIYSTRCGVILSVLDPNSSTNKSYKLNIIDELINGQILPSELGNKSAAELCPQATINEREDINNRNTQKIQMKESTLFKCPHCGVRKCSYREVQTRALDEAPDYMCLCLGCNRRFKGRS